MTRKLLLAAKALTAFTIEGSSSRRRPPGTLRSSGVPDSGPGPVRSTGPVSAPGRRFLQKPWLATLLGAFLLVAVLTPYPRQTALANGDVLIQNTGQTSESGTTSMAGTKAFAQGVVAGDSRFLSDICVQFGTQPKAKDPVYVELWSSKLENLVLVPDEGIATFWWDIDNGTDGDGVCEGTGEAEFTRRRPGTNHSAVELNSGDLYFVVLWAGLNNTDVTLRTTASNAEDSGGVAKLQHQRQQFQGHYHRQCGVYVDFLHLQAEDSALR